MPKVVALKGTKKVWQISSGNRTKITVLGGVSCVNTKLFASSNRHGRMSHIVEHDGGSGLAAKARRRARKSALHGTMENAPAATHEGTDITCASNVERTTKPCTVRHSTKRSREQSSGFSERNCKCSEQRWMPRIN